MKIKVYHVTSFFFLIVFFIFLCSVILCCQEEDFVTVHIAFTQGSESMEDFDQVLDAINERIREKLQLQLQIDFIPFGESGMMEYLLKNSHADLICVSNIKEKVDRGLLLPLDHLLNEEGSSILEVLSPEYLDLGKVNGSQYTLIRQIDMAQSVGICMRKDLVDKYHIDLSAIETWEDFESILEIVTSGENAEGTFFGVVPDLLNPFDTLGDKDILGVLMSPELPMQVVNYYETSEFREWLMRIKEWEKSGYLYTKKDLHYTKVSARPFLYQQMRAGTLFSYIVKYKPGIAVQESKLCQRELVSVKMDTPVMTTDTAAMTQWGIYAGSNHPKEAMQILNFLYSDSEVINLICWGLEGKHYEKNIDGTLSYPEGKTESTIGYHFTNKWLLPNPYLAYVWEGDDLDLGEKVMEFNDTAIRSPALGFLFDSSSVSAQCEKTYQITQAYLSGFLCGAFDVDTMLPNMISDLKEQGSEEIIAEKQRQLDEWYSSFNDSFS